MAKVVILTLPYPHLVTEGIRYDFEGCMNLLKRTNKVLQTGLRANLSCPRNEGVSEISYEETAAQSPLRSFIYHYHQYSSNYDITSFFEKDKLSKSWAFKMDLTHAFAYGNVVEFAFDNIEIEKFLYELHNIDVVVKQLFDSSASKKIYKMYLDSSLLVQEKKEEFFNPPILTVFVVVIVTETVEEFQKVYEIGSKIGVFGKIVINESIAIGAFPATNFIHEPFFSISINPVLVNLQKKNDYKFVDALSSILYLSTAIGEIYNSLEIMSDVHELCVLGKFSIPIELYEKIGRFRINPIKDLFNLYGLKYFRKFEKMHRTTVVEDVNYFLTYGTKGDEILRKKEGIPHFSGLIETRSLIDSYKIHEPDQVIFKKQKASNFIHQVDEYFEKEFAAFKESINSLVKETSSVIEGSRTTVQLNIAIAALFWTLFFTVILSPEVFATLKSLAESIWENLIKLWSSVQAATSGLLLR